MSVQSEIGLLSWLRTFFNKEYAFNFKITIAYALLQDVCNLASSHISD